MWWSRRFNFSCTNKINLLNPELNPIRHLLALVGSRHIVHFSSIRVKKIDGDRVTALYYHCLFNLFEFYLPKTKSNV